MQVTNVVIMFKSEIRFYTYHASCQFRKFTDGYDFLSRLTANKSVKTIAPIKKQ